MRERNVIGKAQKKAWKKTEVKQVVRKEQKESKASKMEGKEEMMEDVE